MRNKEYISIKKIHDYEGIKLNFIWDIVTEDIIKLKNDLEQILSEFKE